MKAFPLNLSAYLIDELATKLFTPIKYGESASSITYPESDIDWTINAFLKEPAILKKHLGKYYKKYIFVLIYADKENEDDVVTMLLKEMLRRNITPQAGHHTIDSLSSKIIQEGYELFLFVDNAESLVRVNHKRLLLSLLEDARNKTRINAFFFFEANINKKSYISILPAKLLQNMTMFPLWDEHGSHAFIHSMTEEWNLKLTSDQFSEISSKCGGHIWLMKDALRFLRDNPTAKLEDAWNRWTMHTKLEKICRKFSPEEYEFLESIATRATTENEDTAQYLESLGIIKKTRSGFTHTIELLRHHIQNKLKRQSLSLQGTQLFLDRKNITNLFSDSEHSALMALLRKRGSIVSREELARSIWGDTWENKFSDWALDKLILRVRKRLATLGFSSMIQTKKRIGFFID